MASCALKILYLLFLVFFLVNTRVLFSSFVLVECASMPFVPCLDPGRTCNCPFFVHGMLEVCSIVHERLACLELVG